MPRPQRIQYPNAYYHVMNRGLGRKAIYHGEAYYLAFLKGVEEAHDRFGLQVLSYCLMTNHYHLLVKTPEGNLSRAMRHINGVYTQRHNRLKKTDGPLFRGRYKAILVESDSYQLQLSRYIHRNPLEANIIEELKDYRWSSYPIYVSSNKSPSWLYTKEIYNQLGVRRQLASHYEYYVEEGVDEDLKRLYSKTNQVPYLGSEQFREWAYKQRDEDVDEMVSNKEAALFRPSIDEIIERVSVKMKIDKKQIVVRGYVSEKVSTARKAAMYLCHRRGGHKLKDIAAAFDLKRYASVSTIIKQFDEKLSNETKLKKRVERMI